MVDSFRQVADEDLTDGHIARLGIEPMPALAQSGEPLFLAVGFKKPHLPIVAPKKYWDMYDRSRFSLADHRGGIMGDSGYTLHDSSELRGYEGVPSEGPISEDLQRECIHGYYACTTFIDAQVGSLVDELASLGLSENTTVVLRATTVSILVITACVVNTQR